MNDMNGTETGLTVPPTDGKPQGNEQPLLRGVSLRLNTLANTRKTYARLIRAYFAGRLPDRAARTGAFMMSGLIAAFRLEKDLEIEARLEELERRLEQRVGR